MTSPGVVKAPSESRLKYQVDEEKPKPTSKAMMIAGHTMIIGVVILLLTFLVRTSLAEVNGNVVSNRVNNAIVRNRAEGKLMHAIAKRSATESSKSSKETKKEEKVKNSTTPKPNNGHRIESVLSTIFGLGALTLMVSRI